MTRPGRRFIESLVATATAALVAVFGACGGGVGTGGTGGFASNYTYGQITGFGSVIVSDVRFDDSAAQVVDDRGTTRSRDELRLGMTVSIDSGAITQGTSGREAKAGVVRFGSVLEAPITSANGAGGTFVALGQTVRLQASTVFDDDFGAGPTSLAAGRNVEVHGYVDAATQSIIATRVEGFAPAGSFKARGVVAALDAAARRMRIGAAEFDYAGATDVPSDLAAGRVVTVYVQPTADPAGRWVVTRVDAGSISAPSGNHDSADVRGVVTAFTSTTSFVVNDVAVDARTATFPDGTAFGLGSRVKVEGRVESKVLIASKVEIDSDDRVRGEGIKLRGNIEAVDAANRTFQLRRSTVDYGSSGVSFDNGSASDIAVGREVEVEGELSSDGTRVDARRIKFR
jgi:hypothetical protein